MFNVVEKNQKLVKGILMAVTGSFVLWGVGNYLSLSSNDGYVAKVGNNKIYSQDVDNALKQQQQSNPTAQVNRQDILGGLVNRQLLMNAISDQKMSVSIDKLQDIIIEIPEFQTSGKFDLAKYKDFLQTRGMTAEQFQKQLSDQILLNQVIDFYKNTYFSSSVFNNKFSQLLSKERSVAPHIFKLSDYYAKVNISESTVAATYQSNLQQYATPAKYKLQYINLSSNDVVNSISISDAEITNYVSTHQASVKNNQVDVSHILFAIDKNADVAKVNEVKAKAEIVLAKLKQDPKKFTALATQYSQDPGTAKTGGDLGFITKGAMVKEFDDVAFSMKPGELSGLVRTKYGFHILKLNAIKGGDSVSIKADAVAQLRKQKTAQALQFAVAKVTDVAYNQPNSLEPSAKALGGLAISTTDWVSSDKKGGLLDNPKILAALAKDDVSKNHHNSEVINLGEDSYVVFRVVDYKAPGVTPFSDVKSEILLKLKNQEASKMSVQDGTTILQQIKSGKAPNLTYGNTVQLNLLSQDTQIPSDAIKQIFGVKLDKVPAYTGVINPNGEYVVYKIISEKMDSGLSDQNKKILTQLDNQYSIYGVNNYIMYLRNTYTINMKDPISQ